MNIYEFLANSPKERVYDKTFIRWYQRTYGVSNVKRKKDEWEKVYSAFLSDSESNPHVPTVAPAQKEVAPVLETPKETISKGDK